MEKIVYTGNLKAIQKLTGKSLEEVGEAVSMLTKTGTMLEQSPERVKGLLEGRRGIVAILNGTVVGFGATTQIYPDGSREIGGITVSKDHRGKRIGTELFRRAVRVEQKRNHGAKKPAMLFAFTNPGSYGIATHQLDGREESDPTIFHEEVFALCQECPKHASLPKGQLCCDRPVIFPLTYVPRSRNTEVKEI